MKILLTIQMNYFFSYLNHYIVLHFYIVGSMTNNQWLFLLNLLRLENITDHVGLEG